MNIKSLLIGSAALATVSTGAQAADAIVMADPEPMEYVRICDVYGAGFFYIPGTETCLKIGGYMRYQINTTDLAAGIGGAGFNKLARFAPNFDVRSDTEIGTLRGFAEVEINWQRGARVAADANGDGQIDFPMTQAYGTDINLAHAYIEIIRGSHTWRFGGGHSPWSRYLGYALWGINDLGPSFRQTSEISYTFTGSNGFNFIAALVEDGAATVNFIPDVEVGIRFDRSWGHIGLIGRGDFDGGNHGAKASLLVRFGNSGVQWKTQAAFEVANGITAVTGLRAQFTPKFAAYLQGGLVQNTVRATLGADITPAANFLIRPEVAFNNGAITAHLRFNRSF